MSFWDVLNLLAYPLVIADFVWWLVRRRRPATEPAPRTTINQRPIAELDTDDAREEWAARRFFERSREEERRMSFPFSWLFRIAWRQIGNRWVDLSETERELRRMEVRLIVLDYREGRPS